MIVDLPPPHGLCTPIVTGSKCGVLTASRIGPTTASNPSRSTRLGLSSHSRIPLADGPVTPGLPARHERAAAPSGRFPPADSRG